MSTNQLSFYNDFSQTCRATYLSSHQIASFLNTYLELSDEEFRIRIQEKMNAKFENQLKAFCCARDAIVLSTFADTFSDKAQVKQYADHLVESEDDYDIRLLRVQMFQSIAKLH